MVHREVVDESIKLGSDRPCKVLNGTFIELKKTGILITVSPKEFYHPQ